MSELKQEASYIVKEICSKCGLCAAVCPSGIIEADQQSDYTICAARQHLCIACGHCMAICSSKAIHIKGLDYERDFFALPEDTPADKEFYRLLTSRRSVRVFQPKPVPQELLERIVAAASLAPMAFTPHKTEVTVIAGREIIEKSLPLLSEFYTNFIKWFKNPFIRMMMKSKMPLETFNTLRQHLVPLLEARLPIMQQAGKDIFTRGAPAMLLFHADHASQNHTEDGHIAATYALLAAHALGLGAVIIGYLPPAINKEAKIRAYFQIPPQNEAVSCVVVGYAKYRYKRAIKRQLRKVSWL
jgi:nitroreductase/NAD-dependent dihydropyrimidine dehydrogenase PreA subunit